MKWNVAILVLFLIGVAILVYAFFMAGSIASCDITCQETIMPRVVSSYKLLNALGLGVLLCGMGILVWRIVKGRFS
jgi:hypothetical protein